MTRHRTITGFVAVALLAVAASAATMRSSHSPSTEGLIISAGTTMSKALSVDANELPAASFDDRWSALSASKTDTPER